VCDGATGRGLSRREVDRCRCVDFVLADGTSEALQTELKRKHIPFVVVSAYPRALVRVEPDQEILQKPVKGDELCGRVEAACALAA
jgi:hypothetical protein